MIIALAALCAIGVAMIYSTTHGGPNANLYIKQLYAIAIGCVAFLFCLAIDYRSLADNSLVFYASVIALLVGVLLFGAVRRRRAALDSPPVFQPPAFRVRQGGPRAHPGQVLRREPAGQPVGDRPGRRRHPHGRAVPVDREAAGPRHRDHAPPHLPGRRLPGRDAHAPAGHPPARRHRGGAGGLALRIEGLSEEPHLHVPRSGAGRRAAPATSRSRRASASGRAGRGARGS